MLLDIKCSVVSSIKVSLTFEDGTKKENIISLYDLIDVTFNQDGIRKEVTGRVVKINVDGCDPKRWYIIVDAADDFSSKQYRFSPMNILDLEIISKHDAEKYITSPADYTNVVAIRVVKGRLQYSQDGITWHSIKQDARDIIYDEEGTCSCDDMPHHHHDDEIRDEES